MYRETPKPTRLQDYQPPEFLIDQTELRFELDAEATWVSAELEMRRNPAAKRGDGSLRLDGEQLTLEAIALNGRELVPVEYQLQDQGLVVQRVPDRFQLRTRVRIHPTANTALEGLYVSGDMLCTQCEAEGFRRLTYYLDRPDVMARFRVTLIADAVRYPVLLSNGNRLVTEVLPDGRHLARWEDPFPKPSYLFALVAGDLACVEDRFRTASGREIALHLYVEPQNHDQCAHAMRSLQQAMRWDEVHYGREYDLDLFMIVAVSHFNMGAMENKGLNIFNAKYVLASPETATDQDFAGIESVVAHEYFHNWTGNRITCRDWFQLSLKEGLTVFRDQEFSADQNQRAVQRIADVRALRARQFPEDAGPMAHPVRPDSYIEINNFYTSTVYEKGAELVRMQAQLLGPERFRAATDLYFERHDGQAVTTEDFVRCMEDASGLDLTQFRRWYQQAGTPVLDCRGHWEPERGVYRLEVRQHTAPTPDQPDKQPLHIPLALGLIGANGQALPVQLAGEHSPPAAGTRLLELREAQHGFEFIGLSERPVPSLLRGFSAPVKLRFPYSDEELRQLMAADSDGVARWNAAQQLAERVLLARVAAPETPVPPAFLEAFATALRDPQADPALLAEVLALPSESYLGDQMEVVDVEGIHQARETLMVSIAGALRTELLARYQALQASEAARQDPDLSPAAMGRRALKNLCLGYLMRTPDLDMLTLCQQQFEQAHTMTDRIAALCQLARLRDEAAAASRAEQALAAFYQQWSREPLVLDKWFAIQAQVSTPGTLRRVEQLLAHEAFTLANPNRVRSLIGAFASGNPLCFHAADGGGYRLLAAQIKRLDALNPQLAARLLHPLTQWRRYDAGRQALMRAELHALRERAGVSRDLFEVLSKTLEA
ncbi:aminopeptidase N [Rhabdochromatium marinum]|uniref:aminopeptidase N n=1 Tax=Rhabdochromatium marinum TaxID=48729 RepID=UPI001905D0AB|nr:aminopeptidase N [Rhabdochromatium marinum]MBK1649118.1 aminopeptidase N [Rhabdochromatium marinum]